MHPLSFEGSSQLTAVQSLPLLEQTRIEAFLMNVDWSTFAYRSALTISKPFLEAVEGTWLA
jgi:hypothetical protein